MMNQEPSPRAARPAAEAIALQHPLSHTTEKPRRVITSIVTATAAPESFQFYRLFPAQTEEGQLMPFLSPRRKILH
jgi:hypothetical protein